MFSSISFPTKIIAYKISATLASKISPIPKPIKKSLDVS